MAGIFDTFFSLMETYLTLTTKAGTGEFKLWER
jgi:hypothetical protein